MKEGLTPQERNELFQQMSRDEQRIHILYEALHMVQEDIFIPYSGYLSLQGIDHYQPFLSGLEKRGRHTTGICHGCAVGSILVGSIACTNKSVYEFRHNKLVTESLQDYFTTQELCLIETAYEQWEEIAYCDGLNNHLSPDEYEEIEFQLAQASRWSNIKDNKDRMVQILSHLIANKGRVSFEKESSPTP